VNGVSETLEAEASGGSSAGQMGVSTHMRGAAGKACWAGEDTAIGTAQAGSILP